MSVEKSRFHQMSCDRWLQNQVSTSCNHYSIRSKWCSSLVRGWTLGWNEGQVLLLSCYYCSCSFSCSFNDFCSCHCHFTFYIMPFFGLEFMPPFSISWSLKHVSWACFILPQWAHFLPSVVGQILALGPDFPPFKESPPGPEEVGWQCLELLEAKTAPGRVFELLSAAIIAWRVASLQTWA